LILASPTILQIELFEPSCMTIRLPLTTYSPLHMVTQNATPPRGSQKALIRPLSIIPADVIVRSTKIAVARTTSPPPVSVHLNEASTPLFLSNILRWNTPCLFYLTANAMPEVTHPKQYMLHVTAGATYDPKDHQDVLINTEKPMHISSDLIDAKLHMRIKDYRGTLCALSPPPRPTPH
jgi:hypothetical protein